MLMTPGEVNFSKILSGLLARGPLDMKISTVLYDTASHYIKCVYTYSPL